MRKRHQTRLHLLSVRQVQTVSEGDHGDGGGLVLRVRGALAHFVFRFTAPSGKRREMGLGPVHRSNPGQAGHCLTAARELAAEARAQLQRGLDPIDERERLKGEARAKAVDVKVQQKREQLTLARAARAYHESVIEPSRTDKHGAQWISSLENHVPAELWNAAITTITAPALLDFLIGLHNKVPETAMRVRQRLEAVFEDAVFRGLCGTNPAAATKRKLREVKGRREKGQFSARCAYCLSPFRAFRVTRDEGDLMQVGLNRFLVLAAVLWAGAADAQCVCRCSNGENVPLCRSSLDLPPICPPPICPLAPPSIAPIETPRLPPLGTTDCRQQQVLNPNTGRYEWRSICR